MRKRKILISGTLKIYSDGSQGFNEENGILLDIVNELSRYIHVPFI